MGLELQCVVLMKCFWSRLAFTYIAFNTVATLGHDKAGAIVDSLYLKNHLDSLDSHGSELLMFQ